MVLGLVDGAQVVQMVAGTCVVGGGRYGGQTVREHRDSRVSGSGEVRRCGRRLWL